MSSIWNITSSACPSLTAIGWRPASGAGSGAWSRDRRHRSAGWPERPEEVAELTGHLLRLLVRHEMPAAVRPVPVAQIGEDPFGQAPGVGHVGRLVAQGDRPGDGDRGDGLIQGVVVVLPER